ncbi:hypothetical protein [Gracilimonas sp.]|uniref:hypothetical protein n=1 Tax=Gracilimonas sp. TaxID=1974203 RepID=UPI002871A799|nr:hypothetical protein [Gracilimonas sp.]
MKKRYEFTSSKLFISKPIINRSVETQRNSTTGLLHLFKQIKSVCLAFIILVIGAFSIVPQDAFAQTTFYDADFSPFKFRVNNSTLEDGANREANGAVQLYQDVIQIDGDKIDAIIRNIKTQDEKILADFDPDFLSGVGAPNATVGQDWLILNFSGGNGGGIFEIEFIEDGSFNSITNEGTPVTLQNVVINSYDHDGGDTQFVEFGGFGKSELSGDSFINTVYNSNTSLTRFIYDGNGAPGSSR